MRLRLRPFAAPLPGLKSRYLAAMAALAVGVLAIIAMLLWLHSRGTLSTLAFGAWLFGILVAGTGAALAL